MTENEAIRQINFSLKRLEFVINESVLDERFPARYNWKNECYQIIEETITFLKAGYKSELDEHSYGEYNYEQARNVFRSGWALINLNVEEESVRLRFQNSYLNRTLFYSDLKDATTNGEDLAYLKVLNSSENEILFETKALINPTFNN